MKKKSRIKLNKKRTLAFVLFIFSLIMIITAITGLSLWLIDNKKTKDMEKNIIEEVQIEEVEDNEKTQIIPTEEPPKENPYWTYIKMNLINVDFATLKKTNPDTVGWIQVAGTNINYPFVQTQDNEFYLNHSYDKSNNNAGWVFMDYRNNTQILSKNTILYAHGRIDTTMFGSLKNIFKSSWYDDKNNHIIKLSTPYENSLWQVFSVYIIPTTNDYIQTEFATSNAYLDFLTKIKERSSYAFDTDISEQDSILTLSTCYNDDEKVVLHAKLIKKEVRDDNVLN